MKEKIVKWSTAITANSMRHVNIQDTDGKVQTIRYNTSPDTELCLHSANPHNHWSTILEVTSHFGSFF